MGDVLTWFKDCPNCGGKGALECYEALSSNIKLDECVKCDYALRYEIDDSKDVITITPIYPNLAKAEEADD